MHLGLCQAQSRAVRKFHADEIAGKWVDTTNSNITVEFLRSHGNLRFALEPFDSIAPDFSSVSFSIDSLDSIRSTGVLMQWPPQYFDLELKNGYLIMHQRDYTWQNYYIGTFRREKTVKTN